MTMFVLCPLGTALDQSPLKLTTITIPESDSKEICAVVIFRRLRSPVMWSSCDLTTSFLIIGFLCCDVLIPQRVKTQRQRGSSRNSCDFQGGGTASANVLGPRQLQKGVILASELCSNCHGQCNDLTRLLVQDEGPACRQVAGFCHTMSVQPVLA